MPSQCHFSNRKYFFVMSAKKTRSKWTETEDILLQQSVERHGVTNWVLVASELKSTNRTGKQCRERWVNHLAPNLKQSSWTLQEDLNLLQIVRVFGSQWSVIASKFPGRSPNSVKNRWRILTRTREKLTLGNASEAAPAAEPRIRVEGRFALPPIQELPFPFEAMMPNQIKLYS